jgi:hypothetical protein
MIYELKQINSREKKQCLSFYMTSKQLKLVLVLVAIWIALVTELAGAVKLLGETRAAGRGVNNS